MDYILLLTTTLSTPLVFDPCSLYAHLCTLRDHLSNKNRYHPLAPMLLIAIFAMLRGCKSLWAMPTSLTCAAPSLCLCLSIWLCLSTPPGRISSAKPLIGV